MKNHIQQQLGNLIFLNKARLVHAAILGSEYSSLYQQGKAKIVKEVLARSGRTEDLMCLEIEIAAELERRIRNGQGIAEALQQMLQDGWLNRFEPDEEFSIFNAGKNHE